MVSRVNDLLSKSALLHRGSLTQLCGKSRRDCYRQSCPSKLGSKLSVLDYWIRAKIQRSVRVIVAVDNIDDEKKERSPNHRKLRAGDLVIVALPDFRPEPHEVAFRPEKIEKPDDDKLIALAGVPTFRDDNVYELQRSKPLISIS